jgi:transposase
MADETRPKHPGGRPTKYRDEYPEEVVAYCAQGFSLTAFAGSIGVDRASINRWMDEHEEFCVAVNRAKSARAEWWEQQLLKQVQNGGTGGQATLTIFGLKNHAPEDFRDKTETEHSGTIGLEQMVTEAAAKRQQE